MKTPLGIDDPHPLLNKTITQMSSWDDWVKRWNDTTDQKDLISLLHIGYDFGTSKMPGVGISGLESNERFLFYLRVADGWCDGIQRNPFESEEVKKRGLSASFSHTHHFEVRYEIVRKAFDMLVLNSFKEWVETRFEAKHLSRFYLSERVLLLLVKFFTKQEEGEKFAVRMATNEYQNTSHNEKIAKKFLFKLIDEIWGWETRYIDTTKPHQVKEAESQEIQDTTVRLRAARPWTIEVLNCFERLDKLKSVKELGEEAETKLEEIVLRATIRPPKVETKRSVKSLEEALRVSDSAAWFLHRYRMTTVW
jgi:hypothetical protein